MGSAPVSEGTTEERLNAEAQRELLMAEHAHRAKNMLAIVLMLARQTLRRGEPPEASRDHLLRRLQAVANVYSLLFDRKWEPVALRPLAACALDDLVEGGRLTIAADAEVLVSTTVAVSVCLALNELGTNAVSYGALSQPGGTAELRWSTSPAGPGQRIAVRWTERGGPRVEAPRRRGFGARLLESLSHDLEAALEQVYDETGLIVTMDIPAGRNVWIKDRP